MFLAFQDELLSEGHYYVFLKEEQRRPGKCFTTLSWGGRTGNGLLQGFPRAFLGLEQAGSPASPPFLFIKSRASLLIPREKGKQDYFFIIRENFIILSVTKFIIHCRKHGPQQRTQEYNNKHYEQVFHQSLSNKDLTCSQKEGEESCIESI